MMLPREHGAYATLVLPLLAALGASRPTPGAACFALAACAAFVAHEPALVLLGHRGTRARRELAAPARRHLAASLAIAAALGGAALALSPVARAWLALPVALACAAGAFAARRRERTLAGELVASFALASAAVPVAVAGGLAPLDALAAWGAFCASFVVSTVEVRAIARRGPRENAAATRAVAWGVALAILLALARARPLLALAPLPVLAVAAYTLVRAPSAKALRPLGWTLATSSLATAIAVALALRASLL